MVKMIYILKIVFYFLFVILIYLNILNNKRKGKKPRINTYTIIIFCIFFGFYSIICGQIPYSGDRMNYAFRFANDIYLLDVKNDSFGLYIVEIILHLLSHNPKFLFFSVAFIYLFLTLEAYNEFAEIEPFAILILGLSTYYSFGFYMLKQCISIGFVALSFAEFSKKRLKMCFFYVFIAIIFHETAWIMIPVYLAMSVTKNKFWRFVVYFLLICCVLFFSKINANLIKLFSLIIPSLNSQMTNYLDNNGGLLKNMNYITALKGMPFYFILFFGLLKKEQLKKKIKMYNEFMFLSFFVSMSTILSIFMYWMFRFAMYCYFPVFVFASLILKELKEQKDKNIFGIGLIVMFFFLTFRMWYQYYFWYGGV